MQDNNLSLIENSLILNRVYFKGDALDQLRVKLDAFVYYLQAYPFHSIEIPQAYEWLKVPSKLIKQWVQDTHPQPIAPQTLKWIEEPSTYTVRLIRYGKGEHHRLSFFSLQGQKYTLPHSSHQTDSLLINIENNPIQPYDRENQENTPLLVLKLIDIYNDKKCIAKTIPYWSIYHSSPK